MLKRYRHFFACLLLMLMPLHALATANMLVCNSLMQSQTAEKLANTTFSAMPCHQHMANMSDSSTSYEPGKTSDFQQSPCKSSCAGVCANMCALTAMPVHTQSSFCLNVTQMFDFNSQPYASITQPNLQRPPISFI